MTSAAANQQSIWYIVADLNEPTADGAFMVVRIDTSIKRESGVEGTVISLHAIREEAESVVAKFNGEIQ